MVDDRHKTYEINIEEESETRSLIQPVAAFKRPSRKARLDSEIKTVRFILPEDETVDIPAGSVIILGRQEGNDRHVDFDLSVLYGPASGISRTHAIMQIANNAVYIRDFDSTNGTFLNGSELYAMRDYPVNDGDVIKLGKVKMRVIFIE